MSAFRKTCRMKAQESCVFTEDYYCTESCESVKIDQDVLPREFDSLFREVKI